MIKGKVDARRSPNIADDGRWRLVVVRLPAANRTTRGCYGDNDVTQELHEVKGHGGHASVTDVLHVQHGARKLPLHVHVILLQDKTLAKIIS
jgi:hypothetical protein